MYCVKCKQKTDSKNITEVISMNNRKMLKSICSICGSKKSSFIKSDKSGTGLGDTIIKAIGKIGELHLPVKESMSPMVLLIINSIILTVDLVQSMIKELEKDIKE